MQGPLDHLLNQFSLRAGVFYTGNICGLHDFERDERRGHLHLIKSGPVQLIEPGKAAIVVDRPPWFFCPDLKPTDWWPMSERAPMSSARLFSLEAGAAIRSPTLSPTPS